MAEMAPTLEDERVALTSENRLVLLHDGDIRRALLDFEGRSFHYATNQAGQRVLLLGAGLLLAGAVGAAWWFGVSTLAGSVGAGLLALSSLTLLGYIWRWSHFASSHFLAVDEHHLYVGSNRRAWRIAWELLDAQTMGFERLSTSQLDGVLPIEVAGESIDLHLYHPLTHIEDLQGFMFEVLSRIQQGEQASGEEE